jgi:hypothetical protein
VAVSVVVAVGPEVAVLVAVAVAINVPVGDGVAAGVTVSSANAPPPLRPGTTARRVISSPAALAKARTMLKIPIAAATAIAGSARSRMVTSSGGGVAGRVDGSRSISGGVNPCVVGCCAFGGKGSDEIA